MRNINNYCIDTTAVKDKINSLLDNADDYDVIQLTWSYKTDSFNSLSLFNKRTGELEYDNMLFNMSNLSKYNRDNFSVFLRGTEVSYQIVDTIITDSTSFEYREPANYGSVKASITGIWRVSGYFEPNTYKTFEDEHFIHYVTVYTYRFINVSLSTRRFVADSSYDTFADCVSFSVPMDTRYNFVYALWAGPAGDFIDKDTYALTKLNYSKFNEQYTGGEGDYMIEMEIPHRDNKDTIVCKDPGWL